MGINHLLLLGQNVTPQFLMCSISTNILTVLANFLGIVILFLFQKTSVTTITTLVSAIQPHVGYVTGKMGS